MFYKIFLLSLSILIQNCSNSNIDSQELKTDIFLGIDKIKYLTGDFSRDKVLKGFKNPNEERVHHLREDVVLAFQKMIKAYDIDREGKDNQPIFIISAHRNYSDQKMIWEEKFSGKRKMRESVTGKTDEEKINLILEFSSAPSTSRHHWGTDFDINNLTNSYFETGNGKFLYLWMKKNAAKFGFCQPYNEHEKRNFKGYKEEKWHWSYFPISSKLMLEWEKAFQENKINFENKFSGSNKLGQRPLEYVKTINSDCLNVSK